MTNKQFTELACTHGVDVVTGTSATKPTDGFRWFAIQVVAGSATIAEIKQADAALSGLSNTTHSEGATILGPFTSITLSSGKVLMYRIPTQ